MLYTVENLSINLFWELIVGQEKLVDDLSLDSRTVVLLVSCVIFLTIFYGAAVDVLGLIGLLLFDLRCISAFFYAHDNLLAFTASGSGVVLYSFSRFVSSW